MGAEVVLVSDQHIFKVKIRQVNLIRVTSAEEMYDACHQYFNDVDVAIAAAAVADYKPKNVASTKNKKN
jgi:phosphopantothenoylcysteine decarboxylase/phosphopantothenate--cysteine ligase